MSVFHMHAVAHGGQKRTLDLLGMELQVVVSSLVGSGHQTWVL